MVDFDSPDLVVVAGVRIVGFGMEIELELRSPGADMGKERLEVGIEEQQVGSSYLDH